MDPENSQVSEPTNLDSQANPDVPFNTEKTEEEISNTLSDIVFKPNERKGQKESDIADIEYWKTECSKRDQKINHYEIEMAEFETAISQKDSLITLLDKEKKKAQEKYTKEISMLQCENERLKERNESLRIRMRSIADLTKDNDVTVVPLASTSKATELIKQASAVSIKPVHKIVNYSKDFEVPCKSCKKSFVAIESLRRHLKVLSKTCCADFTEKDLTDIFGKGAYLAQILSMREELLKKKEEEEEGREKKRDKNVDKKRKRI